MPKTNYLYYGDNLDVLRQHIKAETVDLVYLDPPFNSNATYNVLFAEQDGSRAASQIKAFGDTWQWDQAASAAYHDTVEGGGDIADALLALNKVLGNNNMMAYLAMMAPRLIELKRVLKTTGTIYLHCDPTASHYLKILMDAVFGAENFRSEIIWKRSQVKGDARRKYGALHDVLLFYSKSAECHFEVPRQEPDEEYLARFNLDDSDGRGSYHSAPLDSPSDRPNLKYPYKGYEPPAKGWRVDPAEMKRLDAAGRLIFPKTKEGRIRRKLYLSDAPGPPVGDVWTDFYTLQSGDPERLGYPTQKPEALLERIIRASSKEEHTVLDPFCGCGTTIAVAQRLKRNWIGIDITHLAISLMKHRLLTAFGDKVPYKVIGEPVSLEDAKQLAQEDRFQFECWALGLVGARSTEKKKGADQGIDGRLYFHDEKLAGGKTKQIIFSVKSGKLKATDVRDLRGVVDREKAEIGVLITLEEQTQPMRKEAASAGFYTSPYLKSKHPRLQILTVAELLGGKKVDYPVFQHANITLKKAPKAESEEPEPEQVELL